MNVAVLKTKAEQALVETFEAVNADLPGQGPIRDLRARAIGRFAALGLPHRRIEEWKYTDVRERLRDVPAFASALAPAVVDRGALDRGLGQLAKLSAFRVVFVDGRFVPGLSDLKLLPKGLTVRTLADALTNAPDEIAQALEMSVASDVASNDGIDALNLAFMTDGAVIDIGKGAGDRPVLLVFARSGGAARYTALRNVVRVEAGTEATIIEAHVALDAAAGKALGTFTTNIDVGIGARVAHLQCVKAHGPTEATHLARWNVKLGKDAVYRGFHLTSDVALARNDVAVTFAGRGAKLDMSGCFLGRGIEHIDETLVIDHAQPGCESRELFKGVLDNRARGVFQGKVIVRPDAQKTDGKQMAQALMLSPDAEFDSKPELEIYADDVVCGHGSTVAELDSDLLFYLRSRGIPLEQASAMLIESFVGETFDKIDNEAIRDAVATTALDWLHRKAT